MGRQRTAFDEEGPRREGRSEERTMGRQRTAIDEEGPRREGRSEERTMGRQRTAIDGYKENSTHSPSMAVCCATAVCPKKGKSTWGVEI